MIECIHGWLTEHSIGTCQEEERMHEREDALMNRRLHVCSYWVPLRGFRFRLLPFARRVGGTGGQAWERCAPRWEGGGRG